MNSFIAHLKMLSSLNIERGDASKNTEYIYASKQTCIFETLAYSKKGFKVSVVMLCTKTVCQNMIATSFLFAVMILFLHKFVYFPGFQLFQLF